MSLFKEKILCKGNSCSNVIFEPSTFSMLVCELKGLHQTQRLVNRAADWKVIDGDLPQDPLIVDNEKTPDVRKVNE